MSYSSVLQTLRNLQRKIFFSFFRGEEDESLAIKPPQQIARKDKSHHRKEEKRKDKRRHRSHSAEGGVGVLLIQIITSMCFTAECNMP